MAEVELWVPVVRVTDGPMAGSWSPDVPRTDSGFPAVNFTAAIPMPACADAAESGEEQSSSETCPALVTVCRIVVGEEDAEEITAACDPGDLDYALVRACTDIHAAPDGEGLDGEHAKQIFREIAQHITAAGDERIAVLQRALEEAALHGLPFESAQEIAVEHGLV
jgi:hypothetical protein